MKYFHFSPIDLKFSRDTAVWSTNRRNRQCPHSSTLTCYPLLYTTLQPQPPKSQFPHTPAIPEIQSIMSSTSEKSKGSKFKDISSISLTFFLYLFSFHALLSSTGYPLIEQPHPPPIPQPPQNPTLPVSIDDTAFSISEKSSISSCISIPYSHLLSSAIC